MNDKAVIVKDVYKTFKLPHEQHSGLKQLLVNFYKHKRGFEKQKVLNDISFEIKKGEFFGIVGRNGSGKSTLLKLLAGIYAPDKGLVQVNGSLTPFIELGVGFNPELTGRENVFLNGALLGFNRKDMEAMYDDIVEFAELNKFMDQKLKNYSSGMQVRLAFSVAIRAKSDILLIDEVLAVGDATFQKKCFEYFSELKKSKTTVIFVSHDTEALSRYCDRGVLIENGRKKMIGPIKRVVDQYRESLMPLREAAELADRPDKGATNEAKRLVNIKSCRLIDGQGHYRQKFSSSEDVAVELRLSVDGSIKTPLNVAIGMYQGLYEDNGIYVFGASTQLDKAPIPSSATKVTLKLQKPPLKNEEYTLYVSVFGESEGVPYDYLPEAATLRIVDAPELTSRGVIIANHKWSYE